MKQELINLLNEIDIISRHLANNFTESLESEEMDLNKWERLIDGLNQINNKSQEAFLTSVRFRYRSNCV